MAQNSKNIYRIPFAAGTRVKVTHDHTNHSPLNRIDMHAVDPVPGRIVAAADGTVRLVVDHFSERRPGGKPCNNNYVWVEHDGGEWTKYSHMVKDSVTKVAGLKVGSRVRSGTLLGIEGDVGCAAGRHLHHEVALAKQKDFIDGEGYIISGRAENVIPRVCGLPGQRYVAGQTYVSTNLAPGFGEYARHGMTSATYQQEFEAAANCGYRLRWVDGYSVSGQVRFNAIFEPNTPAHDWVGRHGLDGAQYQKAFSDLTGRGYRLIHVDAYASGSRVNYAAIFARISGPPFTAYHGLSQTDHQKRFDTLTDQGFRPLVISVASVGGQRFYAALYVKASIGGFVARSTLTGAQYQQQFDDNVKAGRGLIYLNGYDHDGGPRFSAIWASTAEVPQRARHGMTSRQYQDTWQQAMDDGFTTRAVSGYADGGSTRFAAYWTK